MSLDVDNFVTEMRERGTTDPIFARMSLMVQKLTDGINQVGSLTGVDPAGHNQPPNTPSSMDVKAANGVAHVTITDNAQRDRATNYFVEADTDPNFSNPHVEHLGASRGKFFALPGLNDAGENQPWHFRSYAMKLGSSQASDHVYFGAQNAPTPVTVGGTTQLTPLASTGAGTSSTNGQQGGNGFGKYQFSKQA